MTFSYKAYRLLTAYSSLVLIPLIWVHHRLRGDDFQRFFQRMGRYPDTIAGLLHGHPRIWLHAVSVGEVGVAAAIAEALRSRFPNAAVALSTIREQGLSRARKLLGDTTPCFFAPLDLVGPARKALRMIRPDVLVLMETELWPNLIMQARRAGARIVVVNGRISSRSIHRYQKVKSLMRDVLSQVDAFSMISAEDARRIQFLGAPADRIWINGNAKCDCPDPLANTDAGRWASAVFNVGSDTPVLVAGSTRNPEEQVILDAFLKIRSLHPSAVLILAPRHIERTAQIVQWVKARGLQCQLRTDLGDHRQARTAPVIILDTIGELLATYSVADIVFCGGSLARKGGQNIMEPAMWAKPICFGPSMEDFADACRMIQAGGGGVLVRNAQELAAAIDRWLQFPGQAKAAGQAARQAILKHRGAARKHGDVICRLVDSII